jgi:hypothetical protein
MLANYTSAQREVLILHIAAFAGTALGMRIRQQNVEVASVFFAARAVDLACNRIALLQQDGLLEIKRGLLPVRLLLHGYLRAEGEEEVGVGRGGGSGEMEGEGRVREQTRADSDCIQKLAHDLMLAPNAVTVRSPCAPCQARELHGARDSPACGVARRR